MQSKAWPYEEARKLLKRWPDGKPDGAPVIFETGYGPSGLPHRPSDPRPVTAPAAREHRVPTSDG